MKKTKSLSDNKKGVSSLFISIYVAMLIILLISTLFIGLVISKSGLTEYLRIEQEKMQESILLAGPNALIIEGSEVQAIRVNNTGAITVRIRALYLDQELIFDPSTLENDSYIKPKEALWIQLDPSVEWNETAINSMWTVTTERGTRSSELGGNLIFGNGNGYTPNKFYFGPLMIVFDMFHWRSGDGPWQEGWTIPKGTKDVTWKILVQNVDNRDIIITETSCFTLISNDNAPKDPLPWFINLDGETSLTFTPGQYHFVEYSYSKPWDGTGNPPKIQGITGLPELATCINFLTFNGFFREEDGETSTFGQTVPFEAVLVTA